MSRDFDLEGVIVQILATAVALGFYGAMIVALVRIADGG
jgi:hypothetical protein